MIAKSAIFRNFNKNHELGLNRVMEVINDDLIMELNNVDNYLTGILVRFKGNIVEYVNAGHPELLMKRAGGSKVDIVAPDDGRSYKGYFLGLEAMKMPFRQINFPMRKDDVILMFSDCLNESMNSAGEEYGIERVMKGLGEATGSAGDIISSVVNGLIDFTGSNKFNDDLTVIAIRRLV
jgi:sigma-B regulation protein RsbU (phosphoserine phosphatase)